MPGQPAARKEDQVSHTQAMNGMLLGVGLGVAAVVGAAIVVGTGGIGLPFVLGAAAVIGGSGLAGEVLGGASDLSPCGPILEGIPTILVGPDAKWAAMATAHVACDQHGDDVQIAEGSATVFLGIERKMAARIGDKGTCGFVIGEGCRTVIIGGPTGTAAGLEAGGEVPAVINYALTTLTLAPAIVEVATAGSVALGVLALGRIGVGLLGGMAGAEVLGDVGEHFFGRKGKAVGQLVGGLLGGLGASKGAGKLLPDRLAGPLEGLFRGGRGGGGVASVPEGEGAGSTPAEPAPTFQPHTPESLARGQAAADAFRDGIRRGDDLPGRGPWGPAQALLEAMLGRGPRPAFAGARTGGGGRGGRALFDEGGGVFSPKKGGNVLEARATGTGGGGSGTDFTGRLRGQDVTLPGVKTRALTYTKRALADAADLRKQFESTARFEGTRKNPGPVAQNRANFLKDLANDPTKEAALRAAGIDDAGLARMKLGKAPDPDIWQVHHKLPLDDGGTNAPDNLVLMRNEPYHKVITNAQDTRTGDLQPGQTTQIPDWPVPDGVVYPPQWPIPSTWPAPPPPP